MKAICTTSPETIIKESIYAQVAIPSPLRKLFDYLITEEHQSKPLESGTRVSVPFGHRKVTGIVISTSNYSNVPPEKLKRITSVLDKSPIFSKDMMKLCSWTSSYYHYSLGETLMMSLPKALRLGKPIPIPKTSYWTLLKPITELQQNQLKGSRKQLEAIHILNNKHNRYSSEPELLNANISKNILKKLEDKGIIAHSEREIKQQKFTHLGQQGKNSSLILNTEQQLALDTLLADLHHYQPILLDGITGSGKTEVYLQAIAATLKEKKQALVLIPEISLTPQTISRFKKRFSTPITCLHSRLSDGERLNGWHQAASETTGIIIATRSGIFTPLPSLGLIIVDEEHDASYKQQDTLRYNARDLAIYRAKLANCPIILGSATPSLETYHNATSERFKHIMLRQRAGGATPPKMKLLDMRRKTTDSGLALELIPQISSNLDSGNQVLIFLNRRGYAPSLICHNCGTITDCPHCDSHMTIHRQPPHIHCHHCDFQQPIPNQCSYCDSIDIQPAGQGTEKIEQVLIKRFPSHPTIRIDRDSTRKKNSLNNMLDTIATGNPCILIGTQILAKGHHFPGVTLVIILNADAGLFSSDFRGIERTGQLIMQVSGRAGRGSKPGQVVIQTYNPQHAALQTLTNNSYTHFLDALLKERFNLRLPPLEHLAMIRVDSVNSNESKIILQSLRKFIESHQNTYLSRTLGPIPAPMEKQQGRFRWQLFIQSALRSCIHASMNLAIQYFENKKLPHYLRWSIDVDPQNMT